jgi:hypothetical protein
MPKPSRKRKSPTARRALPLLELRSVFLRRVPAVRSRGVAAGRNVAAWELLRVGFYVLAEIHHSVGQNWLLGCVDVAKIQHNVDGMVSRFHRFS